MAAALFRCGQPPHALPLAGGIAGEALDDANAAALSLLISASGNVNVRLKPLLTVEDIDEAVKKTPSYRAPGQ